MLAIRRQQGLAAAIIVIVVILALVALALGRGVFDAQLGLDQRDATEVRLRRVAEALAQFASLNQRLPCPAAGTSDTGAEDATTGITNCNSADGVVPWSTLALKRDDGLDGWGRKISYRVYQGSTGFTQAGGISMSDCNTNAGATAAVDGSGKCPVARQTPPANFLAGKGLQVQLDAGGPVGGFAYLLVSHGESGYGAFGATGSGRSTLPSNGSLEIVNTQAAPASFNSRSRSAAGVLPGDVNHFDDSVLAVPVMDVVNAAKLTARDWGPPPPPPSIASRSFTATEVESALGMTPGTLNPSTNANTETNDIDFGDIRVRAFTFNGSLESRNVAFGQGTSGQGLGVIASSHNANGTSSINAAESEALRFRFDTAGRYLGITLIDFGTESGQFERVRFTFDVGGSTVQITKTACRAGAVLANFTLNPGGNFDEVFVEARTTSGGADFSRFLIKSIATCPSANPACQAPGAAAGDNCP